MNQIVILGAGKIGRMVCHFMSQSGSYSVRIGDAAQAAIDHVLPRSRGGLLTWQNCVLACVACNKRKGSKTPGEAKMQLLTEPAQPDWRTIRRIPPRPIWSSWEKFLSDAYWQREMSD